jgi:hypothetical protein
MTEGTADSAQDSRIDCAFAVALPAWQGELPLQLPMGSRVADAVDAALVLLTARGIVLTFDDQAWWAEAPVGIFGEACTRERRLAPGDRVELYRPLLVDPKAARRARAQQTQTEKGRNPLTAKPTRQG